MRRVAYARSSPRGAKQWLYMKCQFIAAHGNRIANVHPYDGASKLPRFLGGGGTTALSGPGPPLS